MAKAQASRGPGMVQRLADWILAVRAADIPDASINQAKLLLLDSIGCGYAAFEEEAAHAVLASLNDVGGSPQCTVLGSTSKTSAPNAVFVNGSLIRILDLNDYVNTRDGQIGGHPSDNMPVGLAAAEISGASGRDLLAAMVVGYEIYGRLKELMDRDAPWDGVTVSGFAAPAIAGRLLGLTREQLAHALALSGARAVTPLVVRQGDISAAKSVSNALVAQSAMQITMLAKHGLTGPLDLFENPAGLKSVFPDIDKSDMVTEPLPTHSYIMDCHMKAYPCLATGQAIVAAGLRLHHQLNGDVDRLEKITVAIADKPTLVRQMRDPGRVDPQSREAADHSFNFLAAAALLDGEFALAQFDNERWHDPKVRAVMAKLEMTVDASLNAKSPSGFPCAIRAKDRAGKDYVAEIIDPPGFSHNGIDAGSVVKKFNDNNVKNLSAAARDRIIGAVVGLDTAPSCAALVDALANARPA